VIWIIITIIKGIQNCIHPVGRMFSQTEHPCLGEAGESLLQGLPNYLSLYLSVKKIRPTIPMSETAHCTVYFCTCNSTSIDVLGLSVDRIQIFHLLMPSCQSTIEVVCIPLCLWLTLSKKLFFCIKFFSWYMQSKEERLFRLTLYKWFILIIFISLYKNINTPCLLIELSAISLALCGWKHAKESNVF
jgi:hypothetical protein